LDDNDKLFLGESNDKDIQENKKFSSMEVEENKETEDLQNVINVINKFLINY